MANDCCDFGTARVIRLKVSQKFSVSPELPEERDSQAGFLLVGQASLFWLFYRGDFSSIQEWSENCPKADGVERSLQKFAS